MPVILNANISKAIKNIVLIVKRNKNNNYCALRYS